MKIQVNYTEVQYVTYSKEIEVTEAQLKQIKKKEGSFYNETIEVLEQEAAENGEVTVETRQLELF
jgi:hypothetical protein